MPHLRRHSPRFGGIEINPVAKHCCVFVHDTPKSLPVIIGACDQDLKAEGMDGASEE